MWVPERARAQGSTHSINSARGYFYGLNHLGKIELVIKGYRIFREKIKGKTRRGLKNSLKRFKFQAMKKGSTMH